MIQNRDIINPELINFHQYLFFSVKQNENFWSRWFPKKEMENEGKLVGELSKSPSQVQQLVVGW